MKTKPTQKLLNDEIVKKTARAFAYDLLRYTEHGGIIENVTAEKVYEFLENLDKTRN